MKKSKDDCFTNCVNRYLFKRKYVLVSRGSKYCELGFYPQIFEKSFTFCTNDLHDILTFQVNIRQHRIKEDLSLREMITDSIMDNMSVSHVVNGKLINSNDYEFIELVEDSFSSYNSLIDPTYTDHD